MWTAARLLIPALERGNEKPGIEMPGYDLTAIGQQPVFTVTMILLESPADRLNRWNGQMLERGRKNGKNTGKRPVV